MKLNHKYRLIAGLKLLKKELETLFSIDLELKSSLVAKIFHRILVGILMLISIVFLGYNCIPDIPLQVTTDLDVKGQSDTGLDWKTLALIGGVVIGITCVGLAGYYLYHHPEIIPTVFRPWRWFSPQTDPKTDAPKTDAPKEPSQEEILTTIIDKMSGSPEFSIDYLIRKLPDIHLWYNTQKPMPKDYISTITDFAMSTVLENVNAALKKESLTLAYYEGHKNSINQRVHMLISDIIENLYSATLNHDPVAIRNTLTAAEMFCRRTIFKKAYIKDLILVIQIKDKIF